MRGVAGAVLSVGWLLAVALPAGAAERTMQAFVVGIEHYDEDHLDRWLGEPRYPFWRSMALPVVRRQTADWPWRVAVEATREGAEGTGAPAAVAARRAALVKASTLANSGQWNEVKTVRRKARQVGEGGGRKVHLLGVAVGDYASPMIPDLPSAGRDVDLWRRFFAENFDPADLHPRTLSSPGAAELRAALEEIAGHSGQDDLVVFVWSGRGYAAGGRRYLVAADARPSPGLGLAPGPIDEPPFRDQVSLAELSDRLRDRALLAILDTQFSAPEKAHPAFKHALPWITASSAGTGDPAERASGDLAGFQHYPPPDGRDRHLLVFWEGNLEDAAVAGGPPRNPAHRSQATGASRLTRALIEAWGGGGSTSTYGAWLDAAARLVSPARQLARPVDSGRLVLQGKPDRPIFSSGDGVEELLYLLRQRDLREVNLRLALKETDLYAGQLDAPTDKLTEAVLRSELARTLAELPFGRQESKRHLRKAKRLLQDIDTAEWGAGESWLTSASIYWHTEIVGRQLEDPHAALERFLRLDPGQVADAEILGLLVELTRLASSQSASVKLQTAAERLAEIGSAVPELGEEASRLRQEIERELQHQKTNYPDGYGPVPSLRSASRAASVRAEANPEAVSSKTNDTGTPGSTEGRKR